MPEVLEEQNAEPLDMRRYLDVARRRYPYFLIVVFLRVADCLGSQLDSSGKL